MKQSKFIIQHSHNRYSCIVEGKEYYFDNLVDTVHYIAVSFKYEVQVITSLESFIKDLENFANIKIILDC